MPQSRLTRSEKRRLDFGNQHSDYMNLVEYWSLKGYAQEKGVPDWTAHIDSSLSYYENLELLDRYATRNSGQTMRELAYRLR